MLEDTLLKIKFNRGDRDALRQIYEKYKNDLLKLAVALLNDINLAEDAVNDGFVAFARCMGKIRLTGNLKSFLTTCIANCARNIYRGRKRKKTINLDKAAHIETNVSSPVQSVIFSEEYKRLKDAMTELPYEQREIVILHCCHSMKFRQVARLQDISTSTAKSRYRYGLSKLRAILDGEVQK